MDVVDWDDWRFIPAYFAAAAALVGSVSLRVR